MGLTVLRTLCQPFGRGFRVTDKTQRPQRITLNRRVALPFILLLVLHLGGLAFAFASGRPLDQPDTFPIVVWFAVSNVAVLWMCLLVSMDIQRARVFPRFEHRLPFELAWDGGSMEGETHFVSENEVTIPGQSLAEASSVPARAGHADDAFPLTPARPLGERTTQKRTRVELLNQGADQSRAGVSPAAVLALTRSRGRRDACPTPERGLLCLPSLGLGALPVRMRRDTDGQWSLEFVELSLPQRRLLVEFLYCRPGQWETRNKGEIRGVWEYLRAGARMYPLAEST
jgi:cellulose synthase (UDP-forming)